MMEEAIGDRHHQGTAADQVTSVSQALVGGDDGGPPFVAVGN